MLGRTFQCVGTLFALASGVSDVGAISGRGDDARLFEPDLHEKIRTIRRFGPVRSSDPHANRTVSTGTLYARDAAALRHDRKTVFSQVGVAWQMRASLYDGNGLVGLVAVCRSMSAGDFEPSECAALDALVPVLLDGLSARARLASNAVATGDALDWLEDIAERVYVITKRGAVAWANRAARDAAALPPWLASAARGERAKVPPGVRLRAVQGSGMGHTVVVCPLATPAEARRTLALAPRYARIAERIAEGLSDKEIALATGLSVATVRTYVAEAYRQARVRSRVELARRVLGHDRGTSR